MEENQVEPDDSMKQKPKLHIWNKILEEDEICEKLAANMNKLSDRLSRKFIHSKNYKPNLKKNFRPRNSEREGPKVASENSGVKQELVSKTSGGQQLKGTDQPKPRTKKKKKNKNRRKNKDGVANEIIQQEARKICHKLNERRMDLITRVVRTIGIEEANKLCAEVQTIEEAGGMMIKKETRRRTPGGIYFHLIKNSGRYPAEAVSKIFRPIEVPK